MQITDINTKDWSIRQFHKMAEKELLLFDYPIQRSPGQWKKLQRSLLIHSLAADYPIPAVYLLSTVVERDIPKNTELVTENVTVRYVLDGVQRFSSTFDFIDGLYSLDAATPPVLIDGEEFPLAKKYFKELAVEVQEMILSRTIHTHILNSETATDELIEDLFFRMNNGTGLSIAQKAKPLMGTNWAKRLKLAGEHVLIKELAAFSASQIRSDGHIIAIMQTMMMIDEIYNYKNVTQSVISEYGQTFRTDEERKFELLKRVVKSMDYLTEVFSNKQSFLLKKVNFPMTLLVAMYASENSIEYDVFSDWAESFKEACKSNDSITHIPTSYMDYSGNGSTDRYKADGRMKEMKRHFEQYLEIHNVKLAVKS